MEYVKNEAKRHSWAIDSIKCLAVLLVLNSHMDKIYPISSLAFGGAFGNALFFAVGGYTWSNLKGKGFLCWYSQKIRRIWIPSVITNIAYLILFVAASDLNLTLLLKVFIYPNKSWFCGAILLYAAIYYFVIKYKNRHSIAFAVAVSTAVYFFWYFCKLDRSYFSLEGFATGGLCRVTHYFVCMLAGFVYKEYEAVISDKVKRYLLPIGFACFVLSYAGKFVIGKNMTLLNFQFFVPFLNLVSAVCILAGAMDCEKRIGANGAGKGKRVLKTIAAYSWELYLVQTLVLPLFASFAFPVSLLVSLIVIAAAAWLLKQITNRIHLMMDNLFMGEQRSR